MQYEVEQKFATPNPGALNAALTDLGAVAGKTVRQVDTYFAHPARDFAATDEALRIRQVGDDNFVTYKGPKIDATTKTRREIELPLAGTPTEADRFAELLAALGFTEVAAVAKTRRYFSLRWESHAVEIVLDDVDGLGTYAELELTVDGEKHRLMSGKAMVLPPNIPHSGLAITACRIMDTFYPVREDYK